MDITKVQQWIMSGMLSVLGLGLSASLSYSARLMMDRDKPGNAYGLWIMGIIVGVLVIGGARLILQRSPLSVWLLLGLLPSAVGAFFLF